MEEQWAKIKDFKDYKISNLGRVKSFKQDKENGKILSFGSSGNYYTIVLRKDNKAYNKYIHRLVAESFIPNINNLPQVNHIDEDTHNNNVDNLEWMSEKDNRNYGTRNERAKQSRKNCSSVSIPVRCIETGQEFKSISEAARFVDTADSSISRVCKGERKTCKGFHWEFI